MIIKMLPNIGNIYHFEWFFTMINNLESLPSNSPPIGENQVSKLRLHEKREIFLATFNGRFRYGWKDEFKSSWLQVESPPEMSPKSYWPLNSLLLHRQRSYVVWLRGFKRQCLGSFWSQCSGPCSVLRSCIGWTMVRQWVSWKEKKKKKKKKKKKGNMIWVGQWFTDKKTILIDPHQYKFYS